jgi:hypothetical protein
VESKLDMVFTGNQYNGINHGSSIKLSKILITNYKYKHCTIVPSGLITISTILNVSSTKHDNINIIYASELYCDSPKIITT